MINTIGHYRIEKRLGAGGMGEVYLATDTRLNRPVAIKVLPANFMNDPQRLRRFVQEARAASAFSHPNVAHIYEIDEFEGLPFIAMEYVQGKTLAEWLKSAKPDQSEILSVGLQIADALNAAHSLGIIHRDIKPNNILLTESNQVKLVDFGLAKMLRERQQESSELTTADETALGMVLGTVPYMSPEQALGQKVDARTDLFSLGTVLYEMATSRRPFSGDTPTQTIDHIVHAQPEPISELNRSIPAELERIIRKCLEKNPEDRYQSAHEILIDLRNMQRDSQSTILHKQKPRPVFRPFVVIAVLCLLGVFLLLYFTKFYPAYTSHTATLPRIAVLPFHLLTANEDLAYLSLGIPDSIVTRLSNLHQIRILPTGATTQFQKEPIDLREVEKQLKADSVLTGTIQKIQGNFRISVQLVRVNDAVMLWGDHYDLAPEDLFKLEDEVAEKVSTSLKLNLTAEDRERVYRRYTQNSAAYYSYLRGRSEMMKNNKEGVLAAVSDFETCLKLDPNYALASAGLALADAEMHLRHSTASESKQWGEKAMAEAEKALQLDPNLAEAHEALASVYSRTEFNWDQTIEESRKALDLNANLEMPHYYIASAFYHLGLLDLAPREVEEGLANGGQNKSLAYRTQGVVALIGGNYQEAVSKLEEAQRYSGKPLPDAYLAHAYYDLKKFAEADALLQQLSHSTSAAGVARSLAARSAFLADGGKSEDAKKLADSVARGAYIDHHVAYDLGTAYALLHNDQEALLWFRRSINSGLPCYPLFARDPLLSRFQSNPEFRELLGELHSKWEKARSKYEPEAGAAH